MSHRQQPRLPASVPAMTLLLLLLMATVVPAADAAGQATGSTTWTPAMSVIVPVEPYVLIVERIAAGRADVHTLVPPGQSPHTYSPTPQQIAAFAGADVLFQVQLELEQGLVPKLQELSEDLLVVDLMPVETNSRGVSTRVHNHESGHDPHVWLNPVSLVRQATLIAETLAELDPAGAEVYAAGRDSLVRYLTSLDEELSSRLKNLTGLRFYVFHPAYGHFAEAYDLEQVAIEADGKEPSAKRLAELVDMARGDNARVIIAQPQHSDATVRTLAREIDAEIVSIDPLAYDLFATLRALADAVAQDAEQDTEDVQP